MKSVLCNNKPLYGLHSITLEKKEIGPRDAQYLGLEARSQDRRQRRRYSAWSKRREPMSNKLMNVHTTRAGQ